MKVLVCGARGFIGARMVTALRRAGMDVVEGVRHADSAAPATREVDFIGWRQASQWLPALRGIDAVVNAVGVLRDHPRRPMQTIHAEAPAALFEACAQGGVRGVIQVSALGIEGNPTAYARTKLAAENALRQHVQAQRLAGIIVRPSIVFGPGGDSSQLFMGLARLPLLCLPAPVIHARVQPIAISELAQGIARLVSDAPSASGDAPRSIWQQAAQGACPVLDAVGPAPLTLAAFIASLRKQLGHAPARVLPLPDALTRWSARLGDFVPWAPWCSETLALLAQDNIAPATAFTHILGRQPTPPNCLLACT